MRARDWGCACGRSQQRQYAALWFRAARGSLRRRFRNPHHAPPHAPRLHRSPAAAAAAAPARLSGRGLRPCAPRRPDRADIADGAGRRLAKNAETLKLLLAHPELFQLENHGAMHVPAVLGAEKLYGIAPAGTLAAVSAEVEGGAKAMAACGIAKPGWYRDATALYSPDALKLIRQMGYRIGGFSLNADFGASLPADKVHERFLTAEDGDVIIGHVNQPKRSSGAGIASGAIALKAKG